MHAPVLYAQVTNKDGIKAPLDQKKFVDKIGSEALFTFIKPNTEKSLSVLIDKNKSDLIDAKVAEILENLLGEIGEIHYGKDSVDLTLTNEDVFALLNWEIMEQQEVLEVQRQGVLDKEIVDTLSGKYFDALPDAKKQILYRYATHQSDEDVQILLLTNSNDGSLPTPLNRKKFIKYLKDLKLKDSVTLSFYKTIHGYTY